jgi:hypothetical protein
MGEGKVSCAHWGWNGGKLALDGTGQKELLKRETFAKARQEG